MKVKFEADNLVQAICEAGQMKLSQLALEMITHSFFKGTTQRSIQQAWLKSPLYCLNDGTKMKQHELQGDMILTDLCCESCGHGFSPGLVLSLTQTHKHKK
tara:strand:- start:3319 stop:3621 length:303 start_codon:yes stop_codon:yes gene_type:complete